MTDQLTTYKAASGSPKFDTNTCTHYPAAFGQTLAAGVAENCARYNNHRACPADASECQMSSFGEKYASYNDQDFATEPAGGWLEEYVWNDASAAAVATTSLKLSEAECLDKCDKAIETASTFKS